MTLATFPLFAAAPRGMESLLADELRACSARSLRPVTAGVAFVGDLATVCRVCLHSRIASRLTLPLARFQVEDIEGLYQGVLGMPWEDHLRPEGTLAVDFTGTNPVVRHTRFGAMKVKDAVVDRLRDLFGVRPSVHFETPDVRIYARLVDNRLDVGIDLSGEGLHRRGYRVNGGSAPLKENLAAAILMLSGWPEVARAGGKLLDPMCGSGTLLVEAAMMAGDMAPGLLRGHFGFSGWLGGDQGLWRTLKAEARERARAGREGIPAIIGCDKDLAVLQAAGENVAQAGLSERIVLEQRDVEHLERPFGAAGLVVVNPPYGERQGDLERLKSLYALLGNRLRTRMHGWRAGVFTADPALVESLGTRPREVKPLFNGAIPCRLVLLDPPLPPAAHEPSPPVTGEPPPEPGDPNAPGAVMFANRLRKNQKRLARWLRQEGVSCYRLYDADMPEYAVAVDVYGPWVHLQEYHSPPDVDPANARRRLGEVLAAIPVALQVAPERVFFKTRRRQSGGNQYRKMGNEGTLVEVEEGGLRFLVNFTDTLDVGLFLDQAPLRRMIRGMTRGRRFLNLFGYTGTATVFAAAGGASATVTVDLSRTYLDWADRNLALNGFAGSAHRLVRADCLEWVQGAQDLPMAERFHVILLDPPTFSNSARMDRPFDLQREHAALIQQVVRLLTPDGVLFFSNNLRRFRMDLESLPAGLEVEEITPETIGPDFARNGKIHHCWRISWRGGGTW
ncbi:MAG: bifunctional 23S rRNA (guanine(2069)-N(7))-methyltransferase RlmK/23S rRNA (guanine(2445)-N(2))-methyltransferase RlmL [Magnetococcales bacterium]|nr:bifunctional 23S rRNA (guanine(2069)-N(7))-methyltransferase RlmK/23S rRNA (guanine(2445)-N(2))-methyltransferase RlmL [Magnetococcales bacterium]